MNELDGVEGGGSKMGNSRVITTSTTCRGSPDSAVGKESACNAGDPSSIPRLGRSAGLGIDYTLQLEKEMATHSRFLAWRIPGTAEPGGLPSMGSHRVGHD